MQRFSIKITMAVSVSALFIFFAALLSYFVLTFFEREEKTNISKQQTALANLLAHTIDDKLSIIRKSLLAGGSSIPKGALTSPSKAREFLKSKTTLNSLFDCGVFIFAPDGTIVASYSERPGLPAITPGIGITSLTHISKPFLSPFHKGEPVIMVTAPLFGDDGRFNGMLGGCFNLLGNDFFSGLVTTRIGKTGYLYIYDKERTLLVHPDRKRIMQRDVPLGSNILFDKALTGFDGSGQTASSRGVRLISTFKHLSGADWIVSVNYPETEAYESLYKAQRYVIIGTLLGTAILLLFVWLLMQRLTAPLVSMTRHVEHMAEKQGDEKLISIDKGDEIGTLARAFNGMIGELHAHQQMLETRVSERTKELEVANTDLEAFNYSLSHDLRIPLSVITGYSQMLLDKCKSRFDEESCEYLMEIEHAGARMADLIEAMLEFTGIQHDHLHSEEVDLSSLFEAVLADLQVKEPKRQIKSEIVKNVLAKGDSRLLMAVFQNLVGNAFKFTRNCQPGEICFGFSEENGETVYFVKDNGAGFDMCQSDSLFMPFRRLHSSKEFPGHGIGLAITRRIIERHGGRIWAEGKVGQGATFYFTIGRSDGQSGVEPADNGQI